jgi:YT521-B-like domain
MAGPVFHTDRVDHVSWASRPSAASSSGHRGSSPPEAIAEEDESDKSILSPSENRMVGESPAPVTPGQEARLLAATSFQSDEGKFPEGHASAPAEPHQPHRHISRPTLPREADTYPEPNTQRAGEKMHQKAMSDGHQLILRLPPPRGATVKAPAAGKDTGGEGGPPVKDADGVLRVDTYGSDSELRHFQDRKVISAPAIPVSVSEPDMEREQTPEAADKDTDADKDKDKREGKHEGWGREFRIEWLRTVRLPFHRTRHLRNPWNQDREVKVSRDGTELEPGVGQKLLDEWDAPTALQAEASPPTSPMSVRGGRGSSRVPVRSSGRGTGGGSGGGGGGGGTSAVLPAASIPLLSSSQLYRTGVHEGGAGRGRGTR